MDAVPRLIRKAVVDDTIAWFGKWAHVYDDVKHSLRRVVVFPTDERLYIGDVGLGILLDKWSIAMACGPGRYPEKDPQCAANQQGSASQRGKAG